MAAETGQFEAAGVLLDRLTRVQPDFPIPGVLFRDLTPVLANPEGLRTVAAAMADVAGPVDLVAGIEARGFLLAGPVALFAGCGTVAIRKAGKLAGELLSQEYALEYGTATLELNPLDVPDGARVLLVDDVLATGGTAAAAARLITRAGGWVAGLACCIELIELGGRAALPDVPVFPLRRY